MPTPTQLRQRLIDKLQELFQLNQPDLDFGFYKIMHAKAEQVKQFLDRDLLAMIETALEAEIYDHLYRFFSRYYEGGDFLSQRFYGRETAGKAATYAIPYSGEEVKLHWANADQFYIKTAEYFNRFTVNLREAKEVKESQGPLALGLNESPLRVTFNLVSGSEGEHGNVKAGDSTKRFFLIDQANPVQLSESGELLINFVYRPDPEKTGTEGTWREFRNQEAVDRVLSELGVLAQSSLNPSISPLNPPSLGDLQTGTLLGNQESTSNIPPKVGGLGGQKELYGEFLALLKTPAPTEKQRDRPLLAKYINQYTARNTMDYFIHKDLGSFLRRELDFYIKNEVMRLDDLDNADCPAVESYLEKVKVLRKIARQLIDFLAQLEDFQKKLWLKKKFVTETQYCLTLDRVPESFYPEIAANDAQREEWVRLFAIDEIRSSDGDLLTAGTVGYSEPLTVEFLSQNRFLVLDTVFFDEGFKARLLATIDNFDDQCDGLLIHSENFQALNLLQERYREQVKCISIDPPYNKRVDNFPYKDNYRHSSWLSMMNDRLVYADFSKTNNGLIFCCIDDNEQTNLRQLFNFIFGEDSILPAAYWQKVYSPRMDAMALSEDHDHIIISGNKIERVNFDQNSNQFNEIDPKTQKKYRRRSLRKEGSNSSRTDRPNLYYPILSPDGSEVYPIRSDGKEGCWRWSKETYLKNELNDMVEWVLKNGEWQAYSKQFFDDNATRPPSTLWTHEIAGHNHEAAEIIKELFADKVFATPKPPKLIEFMLRIAGCQTNEIILDYFAGSGTTAHAVINLNREDDGQRKYILVEMGDHFDTVLKPRIQKVVYAQNWKDGKPKERDSGISHCFKYLRLESYEDTLNNLELNPVNSQFLQHNEQLKREYLLHYLLEIETKGSQSLLNIDHFANPTDYRLKVKIPGTDEYQEKAIDLIETFNYLIGLRVIAIDAPQRFTADLERQTDPELPAEQDGKLVIKGKLKSDPNGSWWFRKIEGTVPKNPHTPNDGLTENVLIVWRNLTGDLEQDNLILDEWFQQNRINPKDFEYDIIYVNGSNNLPNLLREEDHWKVRLIEETFHQKMWDMGGF